jgi:integrase
MLRRMWEVDGAPKLDELVPKLTSIRPRNVTASRDLIDELVEHATDSLKLFLLFCSDLAIRSGTAVRLAPENYDKRCGEIRFTRKYDEKIDLPVTAAIAEMLDTCDLTNSEPFITQLRRREERCATHRRYSNVVNPHRLRVEMKQLRLKLGITKRIIPHDLRRTAAVNLYRRTHNIRLVQALLGHRNLQSTFWYLDHDLEAVDRAELEAIKKPFVTWRREQTA